MNTTKKQMSELEEAKQMRELEEAKQMINELDEATALRLLYRICVEVVFQTIKKIKETKSKKRKLKINICEDRYIAMNINRVNKKIVSVDVTECKVRNIDALTVNMMINSEISYCL